MVGEREVVVHDRDLVNRILNAAGGADMSSHREAPEMAKDPVADSTDVYAFVSPELPKSVTLIANYIPFQAPDGGPNFYEFGDDVTYDINISNRHKGAADVIYRFRFHTRVRNEKTFLYNTGPIDSIDAATWNRPQFYTLTRIKNGHSKVLATHLACPPVNIGPRSTPDYARPRGRCRAQGRQPQGVRRPAGGRLPRRPRQRLRPRHPATLPALAPDPERRRGGRQLAPGASTCTRSRSRCRSPRSLEERRPCRPTRLRPRCRDRGVGVGQPPGVADLRPAHRVVRRARARGSQVSRLGNPLFNEVHRADGPQGQLERAARPRATACSRSTSTTRSSPGCCRCSTRASSRTSRRTTRRGPTCTPSCSPASRRASYRASRTTPGQWSPTCCGSTWRSRRRRAPTRSVCVAGDAAGFPNGRRVDDDVVTVELRAVAGADHPARRPVLHARTARRPGASRTGRRTPTARTTATFPYLGSPGGGYQTQPERVLGVVTATAPAPAPENAWAGQGAVLLDIGGEVGALVVTMPSSMVGAEVEIRPLRGTAGVMAHQHDTTPSAPRARRAPRAIWLMSRSSRARSPEARYRRWCSRSFPTEATSCSAKDSPPP